MGIAVGVGVVASVASAAVSIKNLVSSPSGGGGGGIGGGGSGQTAGNANNNLNDTVNPIYGVHVSSTATGTGQKAPNPTTMQSPKADKGIAENPRATPTQSVGTGYASKDYQGIWADRLSRYLDYNTRALG